MGGYFEGITPVAPRIDKSGDLNALDIAILVAVLLGTMVIGLVATVHAGESPRLAKLLPFLNNQSSRAQYANNDTGGKSDLSSPADMMVHGPSGASLVVQDDVEDPKKRMESDRVRNFFLADRGMKWYFVGGALFASNIGAEHFIGMSGDGARRGMAVAMYEWYAAVLILLLGWVFSPIYRRAGVYTTPEFLEYRFNAGCRHYLSVITCIMYVMTKMSASIYGGAVVMNATLGWNLYLGAGMCIVLSTVYTVAGGLRAVMYTDLFQMCVFVTGGLVVMGCSLHRVGGFGGIQDQLAFQGKSDFWHLFKPTSDEDYPWTGMLIGQPIGSVWYWCMDQDLVQRVLSAKDTAHAKGGCSFASMLKILPPFIIVVPGIVAAILYDMRVPANKTDAAYPILLTNLMPHGVIGLMVASIITAMMSSLASVFAAGSSVITNDIYLKLRPNATHDHLVWVGRVSTIAFAILSFCWIPILNGGDGLYKQIVEIQSYLTPPIGIVLILGVFWKRANAQGALTALLCGGCLGLVRLIFVTIKKNTLKGHYPKVIDQFFYMNFQHFAILLWVTSMIICIIVSLCTPPPPPEARKYMADLSTMFKLDATEINKPRYVNILVAASGVASLAITLSMWIYFA
ncbi:Sodium/glucose cotransporter [Globisporangium polare]